MVPSTRALSRWKEQHATPDSKQPVTCDETICSFTLTAGRVVTAQLPVSNGHLPADASVKLETRTETFEKHFKRWTSGSSALQPCIWNSAGCQGKGLPSAAQRHSEYSYLQAASDVNGLEVPLGPRLLWSCWHTPWCWWDWGQTQPAVTRAAHGRVAPSTAPFFLLIYNSPFPQRRRYQSRKVWYEELRRVTQETASAPAAGLHPVSRQSPEAMPNLIKMKMYSSTCCAALHTRCSLGFQFVKQRK